MNFNSKTSLQNSLNNLNNHKNNKLSNRFESKISRQILNEQMEILQQNKQLQIIINNYRHQIQILKNNNRQHQRQIQSLLKFNERLLSIIEQQIYQQNNNNNMQLNVQNNPNNIKEKSLQPISECTEVDSQVMENMILSMRNNKTKFPKSQIGHNIKDKYHHQNIDFRNSGNNVRSNKIFQLMNQNIMKNLQRSQKCISIDKDFIDTHSDTKSFIKKNQIIQIDRRSTNLSHYNQKKIYESQMINPNKFNQNQYLNYCRNQQQQNKKYQQQHNNKNQYYNYSKKQQKHQQKNEQSTNNPVNNINKQLKIIKTQSQKTNQFLQNKIQQLKNLSQKISYEPQQKFNQIKSKTNLSPSIAQLVRNVMIKKK